jgi:tRNA modification GTPase
MAMTASVAAAACWTPSGRGAIAVIRVRSSRSLDGLFRARDGRKWSELACYRPHVGSWGGEEVVVCRLSDADCEIQCHGGQAAVRRILRDLGGAGIATVDAAELAAVWQEPLDLEVQQALMRAATWRTANILAEQADGLLKTELQGLCELRWESADRRRVADKLAALLEWSQFGVHLSQPWSVVLTGRPNVGKSSLLNALLGFRRAVVADVPGTTRDVVTSRTAFDGWPVELADTAGQRPAAEVLEAAGIALAQSRLAAADLRVLLLDTSQPPQSEDFALLAQWSDALVVAHKADLPDRFGRDLPPAALRVSSRTGEGLSVLMAEMVRRLVPRVPPPGTPVPVSRRQVDLLRAMHAALLLDDEPRYRAAASALVTGDGLAP